MDEKNMPPQEALILRAKLHIRGGKIRLRQGKISAGIVTLYDALSAAIELQTVSPSMKDKLIIMEGENLNDDKTAYQILVRSKTLDGSFDYNAFNDIVEKALIDEVHDFYYHPLLKGIESVMTQLNIMPFDEQMLPPENPSTF